MFRMDVGLVNDGIENVVMLIRDLVHVNMCSFEYY